MSPSRGPLDIVGGLVEVGPPDLVVGGPATCFNSRRAGCADREVRVRGESALQLDAAGVLDVHPALDAGLPPPVEQHLAKWIASSAARR